MAATLRRDQCVYMAKLAEQAERYEEMVQFMEQLVSGATPAGELTVEERNRVCVAFKNVIGSLRAAWRIVSSIESRGGSLRDYNRYLAEFKSGDERKTAAEDTMIAYKAAQVMCWLEKH